MVSSMNKKGALCQLQVVTMDYNQEDDEPFWVGLSNGRKTIRVTEGEEAKGTLVLKNSIVEKVHIYGGFDAFVTLFEKIKKVVGQKIPMVWFKYNFYYDDNDLTEITQLHGNYSSMNLSLIINL